MREDLVVRLEKLADAHDRLEQGGGASEELCEAAAEIKRLRADLYEAGVLLGMLKTLGVWREEEHNV